MYMLRLRDTNKQQSAAESAGLSSLMPAICYQQPEPHAIRNHGPRKTRTYLYGVVIIASICDFPHRTMISCSEETIRWMRRCRVALRLMQMFSTGCMVADEVTDSIYYYYYLCTNNTPD